MIWIIGYLLVTLVAFGPGLFFIAGCAHPPTLAGRPYKDWREDDRTFAWFLAFMFALSWPITLPLFLIAAVLWIWHKAAERWF